MRASALFALFVLALACSPDEPEGPSKNATTTASSAARLGEGAEERARALFGRLTPPDVAPTSEAYDTWIGDVRALLDAAHTEPPDVGLALLRFAMNEEDAGPTPRRLALEAGARSARGEATQLLSSLVREWGPPLELREAAVRALPHADPARGVELLGSLLRDRPRETLPPSESILNAFVESCRFAGTDPVPTVAFVATNLEAEGGTRIAALRHLGRLRGELAIRTLEEVVIESTGNAHLRRVATQELLAAAPRERACAYFRRVVEREADPHMLTFFADLLERNCP